MYNGLLRFNKHILNELAEGLKHYKVGTNKKADYNWKRGDDGQDTDKAIYVLLLGGSALDGFFTTVKLD